MKLFALYGDLTLATQNFNSGVEAAREQMRTMKDEMDGVQGAATKTGSVLEGALGHALGDILAGVTQAAIETAFTFATEGLELASNMEETNAKIDTIFGASAENIHRWAKTTKESYGIGELSAKTYAAQVAGIISTDSKDLTSEEIENISTSLVGLAGDLASFHNMSFSETWKKLLSGLRGETEAIEDLGVDLRASNLAAEFGMTAKEWGALDQRTRLLNTYQYIMQETALAQGDFARTSDSYANQLRQMQENIEQLKLSIGESLLPVMTQLVGWFNSLFDSGNAADSIDAVQEAAAKSYGDIAATTNNALALVKALEDLEKAGEDGASNKNWTALVNNLKTSIPEIANVINAETGKIEGGAAALRAYVEEWKRTQMELARAKAMQGLYETYGKISAELAALEQEQFLTETKATNAQKGVTGLAGSIWDTIVQGMQKSGVSDSEIAKMSKMGMQNALTMLDYFNQPDWVRAANMLSGDQSGQFATNLRKYFFAGGGDQAMMDMFLGMYQGYRADIEKAETGDKTSEIAELRAVLEEQANTIKVLQENAAKYEAWLQTEEKDKPGTKQSDETAPAPVHLTVNVSVDGQEVSAIVEPRVKAGVMSDINWQIQQKMKG